jgi:hypothetical protein
VAFTRLTFNRPARGGFCPRRISPIVPEPAISARFLRNFEDSGRLPQAARGSVKSSLRVSQTRGARLPFNRPVWGGSSPGYISPMVPSRSCRSISSKFRSFCWQSLAELRKREVQFDGIADSRHLADGQPPGQGRILPGVRLPDGSRADHQCCNRSSPPLTPSLIPPGAGSTSIPAECPLPRRR